MALTELEILQRADATSAVMQQLQATWQWDEVSVADFGTKLTVTRVAQSGEAEMKAAYSEQRGVVEVLFDELERRKVQALGMARIRFRHDAEQLAMIEGVGEYGDSREAILKESEEWAATWRRIDPTWVPLTQNTLLLFESLMAEARAELSLLTTKRTDYRKSSTEYNQLLAEMEDLCIAWYAAATRVFAPGTPQGDVIRGQIPTFGDNGTPTAPTPAPTP